MAKAKRKSARKKTAKRKTHARKKSARKKTHAKKRTAKKSRGKRKTGLNQLSYTVSEDLAAVIGTTRATRPQIIQKLWHYIKAHGCQDTKNRRMIVPDRKLSMVLGNRPVDMLKMAGLLNKHIRK